jgi:hypothetical protein
MKKCPPKSAGIFAIDHSEWEGTHELAGAMLTNGTETSPSCHIFFPIKVLEGGVGGTSFKKFPPHVLLFLTV